MYIKGSRLAGIYWGCLASLAEQGPCNLLVAKDHVNPSPNSVCVEYTAVLALTALWKAISLTDKYLIGFPATAG